MPHLDEHDERALWEDHGKSKDGTPAFDVQIDGRMVTVNADDYPSDYVWLPAGDRYSVCRTHRRVFDTRDLNTLLRSDDGWSAYGMCVDCCRDLYRDPTQAEVGLVECPEWWTPTVHGEPPTPALLCKHHWRVFAADHCCRQCIDEDEEVTDAA